MNIVTLSDLKKKEFLLLVMVILSLMLVLITLKNLSTKI